MTSTIYPFDALYSSYRFTGITHTPDCCTLIKNSSGKIHHYFAYFKCSKNNVYPDKIVILFRTKKSDLYREEFSFINEHSTNDQDTDTWQKFKALNKPNKMPISPPPYPITYPFQAKNDDTKIKHNSLCCKLVYYDSNALSYFKCAFSKYTIAIDQPDGNAFLGAYESSHDFSKDPENLLTKPKVETPPENKGNHPFKLINKTGYDHNPECCKRIHETLSGYHYYACVKNKILVFHKDNCNLELSSIPVNDLSTSNADKTISEKFHEIIEEHNPVSIKDLSFKDILSQDVGLGITTDLTLKDVTTVSNQIDSGAFLITIEGTYNAAKIGSKIIKDTLNVVNLIKDLAEHKLLIAYFKSLPQITPVSDTQIFNNIKVQILVPDFSWIPFILCLNKNELIKANGGWIVSFSKDGIEQQNIDVHGQFMKFMNFFNNYALADEIKSHVKYNEIDVSEMGVKQLSQRKLKL